MGEYERDVEIDVNGETVTIHAVQLFVGDVGVVVWDSALLATKYFETKAAKQPEYFEDKTVLELGAGVGLCGIALSLLGAKVLLTDLCDQVALLHKNVERNSSTLQQCKHQPNVLPLEWGTDCEASNAIYDFVVMVDCLYYPQSIEPLIHTLLKCTNEYSTVVCVYEVRDIGAPVEAQQLFRQSCEKYFDVQPIAKQDLHPDYITDDIVSVILKRKL